MSKLKLDAVPDDRPVKLTVEMPAHVHRDLVVYADVLRRETGQAVEPAKLVTPMLVRFMASDRGFAKARRSNAHQHDQTSSEMAAKPGRTG